MKFWLRRAGVLRRTLISFVNKEMFLKSVCFSRRIRGQLQPTLPTRAPMAIGDVAQVVISYAFDPGRFYVQLVRERRKMGELTDQLTKYYTKRQTDDREGDAIGEVPQVGSVVAAPYYDTSAILRAQIVQRGSARGLVVIRYYEYGNDYEVRLLQLRKLLPAFKKDPPFALECALYGMKETNRWSPDEIKFFKDMFFHEIFGKEMTMKVVAVKNDGLHLVEFYDGTTNLVHTYHKLLEESGMPQPSLKQTMTTAAMTTAIAPTAVRNISAGPNMQIPLTSSYRSVAHMVPKVELKPFQLASLIGQTLKCHLTAAATSPDDFYVRLLAPPYTLEDEYGIALQNIHEKMNRYYGNLSTDQFSNRVIEGLVVAAKYSVDNGFYRGKVLKTPMAEANAIQVQYVDFGNVEFVPKDAVFPLLPEFVQGLDALALHCALKDVKPSNGRSEWLEDAVNFFRGHINKELDLVVRGPSKRFPGRADVELLNMETFNQVPMCSATIAGALEERGLCVRTNVDDNRQATHTQRESKSQDPRRMPYPRVQLPRGLKDDEVAVTEMSDPNALMVHLSASKEDLHKVSVALDKYYGKGAIRRPPPIERPAPKGMRCVSKFRSDGDCWYRSEIVIDEGDGAIRVHYVDYGNVDDVHPDDVRIAAPSVADINDIPALALKVRIAGVKFEDTRAWHADSQEKIADMVERCAVELLRVDKDMLHTVAFTDRSTGLDLSTHLIDRELAVADDSEPDTAPDGLMLDHRLSYLQVPGLPKMFIPAGVDDYLNVVVAYISEQRTVFVQMEHRADELARLCNLLTRYDSLPAEEDRLINPRKGQMCAAKCAFDGQWYRGSIVERDASNLVKVVFVDYGNTEEINKNDIKRLDDKLERIPPHAIELAVADPLGNRVTHQQLVDKLENKRLVVKIETQTRKDGRPAAASFFELNDHPNQPLWVNVIERLTDQQNANPCS